MRAVLQRLESSSKTGARRGRMRMRSSNRFRPLRPVRRAQGGTTHGIPRPHPRQTLPRRDRLRGTCRLAPDRLLSEIVIASSSRPYILARSAFSSARAFGRSVLVFPYRSHGSTWRARFALACFSPWANLWSRRWGFEPLKAKGWTRLGLTHHNFHQDRVRLYLTSGIDSG
jgi:hypothetical protein